MKLGIRVKYFFIMTAIFMVGGCQTQQTRQTFTVTSTKKMVRYTGAESLLNTEGYWDLVEEEQKISPMAQHMRARVQVDPNQVKGSRKYTSYKAPDEKTHFRTLRLASMEIVVPDRKPVRDVKFMMVKSDLIGSGLKPKVQATERDVTESAPKPVQVVSGKKAVSKKLSWFASRSKKKEIPAKIALPEAVVKSIRMGEHPGKTRFVLDMTGPSGFEYELDNKKGYLLIDLPGTAWEANTKKVIQAHPLIKGYSVRSSSEGTKILVVLKKPGRLITSVSLPPNPTRGHRIYFDIGEAG